MPQYGRPSADTNNPGSYTDQAAGSTNIYTTIDETAASDADYIQSPSAPSSAVYVTKLSNVEDPLSSAGHTVRVRHGKSAAGGATVNLTVELRQGYVSEGTPGTLIATVMNAVALGDALSTTTYNLSAGEADAITNYNDLYLRFLSTQV